MQDRQPAASAVRRQRAGPDTPAIGVEQGYQLLFEHSDSMVCTLDLEGRFTAVNRAGERLTGYRAHELVGRSALDLIAPEVRADAARRFRERLASREDFPAQETLLVRRDGTRVPIEVTSVLFESGGAPAGVLGLVRDLSSLASAKDALRQSEERFRSAFTYAAIGMALVAPDGRFLQVNDALCSIVGYSADELLARTFQDLTHPDDLEADLEFVRRMLAGEIRTYQMEKRYFHRQGHVVWILLSVSLVRASDGSPLYFISQIQDITERKHAEEALARSEARLAEAQQIAGIGSWEWDVGSDVVAWSPQLYRIFGADPDRELSYAAYLELLHPEDRPLVEETVARALETGAPFEVEHRVLLPGGCLRWIHGRGEVELREGRVVRMRGTAQDITERKEADERLRAAEERYRTLIEQLPLVTYVRSLDLAEPNLYVSPQVEEVLGYPAEAWTSDPSLLARIVHPDDRERVFADAERLRATGEPLRQEYRYLRPDGSVVWVLDEAYVVRDERGVPLRVEGFVLDITERKRAEEERDRLGDELHHAQKLEALGRLAGGIAHDFNNVLTAIRGYSELLLAGLQPGSRQWREAEQIRRAAEQASVLPRQLLAFGRRQVLEPVLLDLDGAVSGAVDLLARVTGEQIQIVTRFDAAGARVYADPGQVEQALINLALNARDAMPGGGTLTLATRRTVVGAEQAAEHDVAPGAYAVVSLSDTGEGMDEATKSRIFEPFFTTKPPGRGSGLGLASVYGIVRQSGGFVAVETELGRGSTFELHIPCVEAAGGEERATVSPPPAEPERASVLLVEDQELVREAATAVLEHAGYRVLACGGGEEALALCDCPETPVDLLLTDMVMPGLSGRELAERVTERRAGVPVVFMSGYSDEAPSVAGGVATRFVQKPFSADELVAACEEALALRGRNGSGSGQAAGERITCLVADDHPAVLDSVSRFLEAQGIEVVGRTLRGDEALRELEARRPTVALLDIGMEPVSGIEVARQAANVAPETRVVLYTGHREGALLAQALDAGVQGFVLKEAPLAELARAITLVAGGGTYVDSELSVALASSGSLRGLAPLTPREREVLTLLADGMTNEKVAAALGISPETVQSHVGHAMTKLEADTRTQAVATALRQAVIA